MDLTTHSSQLLWIGSLTAAPLAILVCIASRWPGCRPATRHAMWLAVIASFITPLFTSLIGRPAWFQSARILEACRGLFEHPQPSTTPSPAPLTAPIATAKPAPALAISPSAPSFNFEPAPTPAATSSEPDALAATPLFAPALTNTPDLAAFIAASSQVPPTQPAASLSIENCLEPATLPLLATNTVTQAPSINTDRVVDATVSSAPISTFTAPRASFAAAAQPAPAKPTTLRDTARTWLSWGLAVRDQFSAVPPLPIMLWFVGAGLMLLVFAIRMIAMRRILARARPARDSMLTLVDSCARQAGLSAAPLTLETHDRLSPMIVCGLRPTLVLPIALWKELDEDARRAVVLHELAHLRRRDHRTAWFVAFVGLVYWWHPIVWWARRRINEEADTCCDAWVTSLLPEGRRAYARALLATKSFLSLPNQNLAVRCAPPGLGVMSGGAKRLARRITMVMTQRTAPRPSVLGAAAAMMIAAVGTFVMPGIACPPSEQPEAGAQAAAAAPRAKARKATRASSPVAGTAPAQSEFFGEATALEAMRAGRDQAEGAAEPGARAGAVGGDAQSLEKAILELERRLEKMEIDLGGQQTPRPRAARNAFPALSPTAPASPFGAMRAPVAVTPVAPLRGTLAVPAYPASGFGTSSRLFGVTAPTNIAVVDSGEIIARTYTLPRGKLEALTQLMRRDDVPIFIEAGDDTILVNATEAQHRTFAAFIAMIHPESSAAAVFPGVGTTTAPAVAEGLARREYNSAIGRYRGNAANHDEQVARLHEQLEQLHARQKNTERQAESFRRRAERAQEQAEKIQEQADEFESRIDNAADDVARGKLQAEFAAVKARMQAAEAQASAFEATADQAEASAEQMEGMIDEMESQIDALKDAMSQAADAENAAADALAPAQAFEAPEAPEIPEAPQAPDAPEAPEAPEAPQPAAAPTAPSTAI